MRALRNLARHPVRSGLTVLGVAITSALLLDMVMLSGGIERSFERLLLGRGFEIRLSPKGTLPFDTEATIPNATAIRRVAEADSAVVTVAPFLGAAVYARTDQGLVTLFAYGVDPTAQALYQLQRGSDLLPSDSAGVLLSEPAQRRLGAAIGDSLTLVSSLDPGTVWPGTSRTLVVRGIVRWLYDYRGQPSIGASLGVVQQLAGYGGSDRVSAFAVQVRDGTDLAATTERLRAALPGVEVNSVGDLVAQFRGRLVYFRQLSYILGTISLIITLLLIGTLLTITVNERIGEIATLRAIGISRARIVRMVMAEGTALTLVGGGLGVILGSMTATYLDRILTSFPGLPAAISFFVPDRDSLAVAGCVLLLSGMCAGILPAWHAARLPIAATLRAEAT